MTSSTTTFAANSAPDAILPERDATQSRNKPCLDVGQIAHDPIAAQHELDACIRELGQRAEQAMADRDPVGARIYADRMMEAIASRTPEHQARLEREAYDRVTQDVAYFTSDAALALAQGRNR